MRHSIFPMKGGNLIGFHFQKRLQWMHFAAALIQNPSIDSSRPAANSAHAIFLMETFRISRLKLQ